MRRGVNEMTSMMSNILDKLFKNEYSRTFLIYSIFRAIYGPIILVISYIFATELEDGIYFSIIILLSSMIFSRIIFSRIKIWLNLETSQQLE
jgi:VIT1/CCC1 family predicted Fe2+/Mn2+ transporter